MNTRVYSAAKNLDLLFLTSSKQLNIKVYSSHFHTTSAPLALISLQKNIALKHALPNPRFLQAQKISSKAVPKTEIKVEQTSLAQEATKSQDKRKIIKPGTPVGSKEPGDASLIPKQSKSFKQKIKDSVNPEQHIKRRDELYKQISESYWQGFADLQKYGPKLFEATSELIPEKAALYFPKFKATSLNSYEHNIPVLTRGKVSIVTFEFAKFAEKHTISYIDQYEKYFKDNKKVQLIQLNIEENWLKAFLLKACIPLLRSNIPKYRHNLYFTHFGSVETIKQQLGISNRFLGYCFLVDKNSKIRWYSNGVASENEAETLVKLVKSLC
ncbi:hypothetical protein BB561_002276 [Smittium simulii]|uniref:Thioredoxin domain-containing protein n=1 Tax=Smittium simulii TaxID=133385 RepID=A0A2T9YR06_9FUNG|nr:hypothetical protein BB561_002276 [Smittium simulii]